MSAKDSPPQTAVGIQLAEWHLLAGVGAALSTQPVPAAELAEIRSGTDAAVAFLRKLVADGLLPAPQRYLAGLLDRFRPVLRRGCDPLRAELTGCEFLGDLTSTVPAGRVAGDGMRRLLEDLVAGVEECGTRAAGPAGGRPAGPGVHRVKVTLRGSKPPIWRRLEVPSATTLERLHQMIQVAFGWYGGHRWVFETPAGEYGHPDAELGHADAAAVTLDEVAPGVGDRIRYVYDFGDDWRHDIVVEEVAAAAPGVAYPRCTAGRRARPPEDCGGMWVYQDLLEVLADPGHPEHAEALNALGVVSAEAFDPARFDRDVVNAQLSNQAAGPTVRLQL